MKSWIFLAVALVLNAAANILLKVGSRLESLAPETSERLASFLKTFNVATMAGLFLFAVNVVFYRKALDGIPISVAYPIMVSLGLVLVVLAAIWIPLLNERVDARQVAGMALIGIGVWLVSGGAS